MTIIASLAIGLYLLIGVFLAAQLFYAFAFSLATCAAAVAVVTMWPVCLLYIGWYLGRRKK